MKLSNILFDLVSVVLVLAATLLCTYGASTEFAKAVVNNNDAALAMSIMFGFAALVCACMLFVHAKNFGKDPQ